MEMENKVFINALSHNMRYSHAIISVQEDIPMISNCLIEAIKAKIKDPKNTRIIYLYPKINTGFWHFLWVKDGKVRHFEDLKGMEGRGLLFKGEYKEQDFESFEAFVLRRRLKIYTFKVDRIEKLARKCRFPSVNKEGFLKWSRYWPSEELYDKPVENKISNLVMIKTKKSRDIKVIKVKDFDKKGYDYCDWKYVSPYCQEWMLYSITER